MKDHDKDLLYQMLSYCTKIGERIESYSIDEDEFVENTALQDMLLMPIFQIGELANALSDEFCSDHTQIPWRAIKSFRNMIAHDYGVVDPDWAWNTIIFDIPELEAFLKTCLS